MIGGYLFDKVGPKAPFIFMGAVDILFGVVVAFLGLMRIVKNDIVDINRNHS